MWLLGFIVVTAIILYPVFRRLPPGVKHRDLGEVIYLFMLNSYLGMGLRGLLLCTGIQQTPFAEAYEATQNHPGLALITFLVAAAGMASFLVGYYAKGRHPLARRLGTSRIFAGPHSAPTLALTCAAFTFAALGAGLYSATTYGWNPSGSVLRVTSGGHGVSELWVELSLLALMVATATALNRRCPNRFTMLAIGAMALGVTTFTYLATSNKLIVVNVVLGLMLVFNYAHRRIRFASVAIVFLALLASYPLLTEYRYGKQVQFSNFASDYAHGVLEFMERSHRFDLAEVAISRTNELSKMKYGETVGELAYFFIPRQLWPDKPISFAYRFSEENTPLEYTPGHSGGDTPSDIGELFLDFGLPGVIAGMFVFGYLMRGLYIFLFAGATSSVKIAVYALAAMACAQIAEGPIAGIIGAAILEVAPLAVMGWLAAATCRPRPELARPERATA